MNVAIGQMSHTFSAIAENQSLQERVHDHPLEEQHFPTRPEMALERLTPRVLAILPIQARVGNA